MESRGFFFNRDNATKAAERWAGEGRAGQRRAGRGRAGGRTLELVIFYFMPFCAFGILNKFPSIW